MTCGIYKIKNDVNGKLYIGQSVDIEERWKQHKNSKRLGHLYSAFKKHGLDNFTFSIICEVPESALDEYEISYIKYYETTNPIKGYNKKSGGANGRPTEETKKKMSAAKKNMTEETKKKISSAQKGKTCSDEHKKKLSAALKKQYLHQGNIYNGLQELADFLGITYKSLTNRISKNN